MARKPRQLLHWVVCTVTLQMLTEKDPIVLTSIATLSDCPDFQSYGFHCIPTISILSLCTPQGFLSLQTL